RAVADGNAVRKDRDDATADASPSKQVAVAAIVVAASGMVVRKRAVADGGFSPEEIEASTKGHAGAEATEIIVAAADVVVVECTVADHELLRAGAAGNTATETDTGE